MSDYSFYRAVEIKKESFEDIKQRLVELELDKKYTVFTSKGEEVIAFGSIGLKAEK